MTAAALKWEQTARHAAARAGVLHLARGQVLTPAFMPVGTLGVVRGAVAANDIAQLGFNMILANTFHLWQRPGLAVLSRHGGLHGFNGWHQPILTDSGGFQVFSLSALCKISEEGVSFRAPHNGQLCFLSPEICMDIQRAINSDIAMVLDDCTPADVSYEQAAASMNRSMRWAKRCKQALGGDSANHLFGIVQGGTYPLLRRQSAEQLVEIEFDGYAIGGLAVGESPAARRDILAQVPQWLPADKPRYLMGMGTPGDIARAVADGIDMFDCVLPTRNARNGQLFTHAGIVRIKNARHRHDTNPLDAQCGCPVCRQYGRDYLHHLFAVGDMLAARLLTLHNLAYYHRLMARLRNAVIDHTLEKVVGEITALYP